jgi:hypothetical protein
MKHQYKSGKIVTREELRELWNRCNPHHKHDDVEFEISLYIDINNGTIKEMHEMSAKELRERIWRIIAREGIEVTNQNLDWLIERAYKEKDDER